MALGADLQRAHLSNPVPDLRMTSAIWIHSFCRSAVAEVVMSCMPCGFCVFGSLRDLRPDTLRRTLNLV